MKEPLEPLMTVEEVAGVLRCEPEDVLLMVLEHRLPGVYPIPGEEPRLRRPDVESLMAPAPAPGSLAERLQRRLEHL